MQCFRKQYQYTNAYRPEGYTVMGRLLTDLVSCETGIPPHNKIKFELDRSKNSFFLMCTEGDTEQYKIELSNICLYIPVAQLSSSVFSEINALLSNPKEPKSVTIHFRKLEIKEVPVPRSKKEFLTDSLFPDSDLPCKIIVCFVESDAKVGDYHKNPFAFQRSWEVEVDDSVSKVQNDEPSQGRILHLENKVDSLTEKLETLLGVLQNQSQNSKQPKSKVLGSKKKVAPKSKTLLKKTTRAQRQPENQEYHNFEEFFGYDGSSPGPSTRNSDIITEDGSYHSAASQVPIAPQAKVKKTFYITKVDCLLNSIPLDAIDDFQSEEQCMQAYWRFFTANGQMNSLFTNSITYEQFRYIALLKLSFPLY
jgi:hypothetical protein